MRDADLVVDFNSSNHAVVRPGDVVVLPLADSTWAAQNLLTTQYQYVMLFAVGGRKFTVQWEMLVPVQALTRKTAECYRRALSLIQLDLTDFTWKFLRVQRCAATDGDGAVARAERQVAALNPDVHHLHTRP